MASRQLLLNTRYIGTEETANTFADLRVIWRERDSVQYARTVRGS